MSLSLATHALTGPIHAAPLLVTRQESGPANVPNFTCTFRTPNPVGLEGSPAYLRACSGSSILAPVSSCYTTSISDSDSSARRFYFNDCVDHCNNLHNGTYLSELTKCWAQECTDHSEKTNSAMLEYIRDLDLRSICEPLGLKGDDLRYDQLFQCTLKPNQPFYRDGVHRAEDQPVCPEESVVIAATVECIAQPTKEELENVGPEGYKPRGKGKEECADYCEMAYNGTLLEETWKCWDEGCEDAREGKYEEMNDRYLRNGIEGLAIKTVCEPLGLMRNGTVVKAEEGKEGAKKDEKDESAADGLKVKKGVVVLAVVFGVLFSGFM